MMARKKQKGLGEKHKRILDVLAGFTTENGYPPSIREICEEAEISSTSVANYYLDRLEELKYIQRDRKVSRGIRLLKQYSSILVSADDMVKVPVVGAIVASQPMTTFETHPETMIDVAGSLLPGQKVDDLFALEVSGDSMVDAMVNDGDIVIMRKPQGPVKNGDMVAVWLNDRDETTLKYYFREKGKVRLQPANPTMGPIIVNDPSTVEIHGKVVMVVRQMEAQ